MNACRMSVAAVALLVGFAVGAASAKLPAPNEEQKAKAAEAKAKSDEAVKKEAELLGRYQDRAADHYKRAKITKTGAVKQ